MTAIAEKTVSQVLNEAADHIENVGWTQGVFFGREHLNPSNCKMCTVGVIGFTSTGRPAGVSEIGREAVNAVCKYLQLRNNEAALFRWNDARRRTRDEVVAALRGAAKATAS